MTDFESNLGARQSRIVKAKTYAADLVERVAWTFLQAFGASLVASEWFTPGGLRDMSFLSAAGIAGLAAALATVKGLIAKKVGNPDTAALP